MARKPATKTAKEKKVEALTHDKARRKNIPTAELQSLAQRQEEKVPIGPIRYSRVYPLKAGTERARDKDIDPQIIWNGARIRLSKEQIRQLQEKGEIEIGDAQLVWRGKDQQDWSDPWSMRHPSTSRKRCTRRQSSTTLSGSRRRPRPTTTTCRTCSRTSTGSTILKPVPSSTSTVNTGRTA